MIIVGGFLFHMMWEAKTLYVIPYFVILAPISIKGYSHIVEEMDKNGSFVRLSQYPTKNAIKRKGKIMFKVEKQLLIWIEKNLTVIAIILGTIFSILIRYAFRDIESKDYIYYLSTWYDQIQKRGGIYSLNQQVGNYSFLYQMCIAIMTYFPFKSLYAYKILSIIFDYLLAIIVAVIVWSVSDENKKTNAAIAYCITIFSPVVILNSSAWAQCDAIYVFWAMFAIYALMKEKYLVSFLLLGISFSFKLQTVFILPFFLFVYFVKKKFSILNFIVVPLTMMATNILGTVFGRNIFEIFSIYFNQTEKYKQAALNYPSFWVLFFDAGSTDYYNSQKPIGILLTTVILAALMIWWISNKIELNNKNIIYVAFILSYTCVLFLPQMHERYGYLYEILAIILLFSNRSTIKLIIPLYIISFLTYGKFLFGLPYSVNLYTGIINILIWLGYIGIILKELTPPRSNL